MKKCSYCGKDHPDEATACAIDGMPLVGEQPPPLPQSGQAAARRFAGVAAVLSLIAPLGAIFIGVLVFRMVRYHLSIVEFLWPLPLVLLIAGLGLGFAAVVGNRRREHATGFRMACAGICVNAGLLLSIILVPPLLEAWVVAAHNRKDSGQRSQGWAQQLAAASTAEERFYALNDAAKESFIAGKIDEARRYATELLALAPGFEANWNYGNAIHDGNLVLGRIALREGRVDAAKEHLLAAGKSPGSPQMNSFGPNMSLAKDLLEKGERDAVLQYFELCRKFWSMDHGSLDAWSQQVKAGEIPDFGANLVY